MNRLPATLLLAGGSFLSPSLALAQDPGQAMFRNVGLQISEGKLVGGGPRYAALFEDGGVRYIPAFGSAAPRTLPVHMRLHSVRRGAGVWPAADRERSHDGCAVRYARPGFTELYEMRLDGLKQSFVFDRLPEGSGDLVVRLEVETELDPPASGPSTEGLSFELQGVGAVTIGQVVGIDARGHRAAGSLRYEAGVLELILPARFVDAAALPLVLDPLVGTTINVGVGSTEYGEPDIAYDASTNVYLVVWEYTVSATDGDIRGQRVSPGGKLIGGLLLIQSGSSHDGNPKVANVNSQNAFAVAWQRFQTSPTNRSRVRLRVHSASTGAGGTAIDVASGPDNHARPDIGGNISTTGRTVVLVWENITQDRILARQAEITGTAPTLPRGEVTVNGSGTTFYRNGSVAIAKSGGATGNYLVVWEEDHSSPDITKIAGRLLTSGLSDISGLLAISGDPATPFDDEDPDVDGDGLQWIVVWERSEDPQGLATRDDIVCRGVRYNTNGGVRGKAFLAGNTQVVEGDIGDDEKNPSVAWAGGAVIVGFQDKDGNRFEAEVKSINPFTCTPCETSQFNLVSGSRSEINVAVASEMSGGGGASSPGVLAAVESFDIGSGDRDILARGFRSDHGTVTTVTRTCTGRGTPHAACARPGSADFQFTLRGAFINTPVFLLMSSDRLDFSCGGCSLVPNPYTGWVIARTTDRYGDAFMRIPIPAANPLRGLTFHQQWLIMSPQPACAILGADFTQAIEVEISKEN